MLFAAFKCDVLIFFFIWKNQDNRVRCFSEIAHLSNVTRNDSFKTESIVFSRKLKKMPKQVIECVLTAAISTEEKMFSFNFFSSFWYYSKLKSECNYLKTSSFQSAEQIVRKNVWVNVTISRQDKNCLNIRKSNANNKQRMNIVYVARCTVSVFCHRNIFGCWLLFTFHSF